MKRLPPFLLLPFALLLAACGRSAPAAEALADEPVPVAVELANVERRDVPDVLSVDGNLVLPEGASSRLAPGVPGRLLEVRVKEGDPVRAGQLLARIDVRALVAQSQGAAASAASADATAAQTNLALKAARADQASAVEGARLALAVAVADGKSSVGQAAVELQRLRAGARPQEIAQARQTVAQARTARDKARLDADRDARLLKEGLVAGSQADASAAALRTSESAFMSAESALELVQAGNRPEDVRASELRLDSARQLAAKRIDQARAALRQAEAGRWGIAAKGQEAAAARLTARQKAADARAAAAAVEMGELRSPIAGYVVRRFLNVGDVADTATPVLAISATRPVADFVGSVSPSEANGIAPGMPVLFGDSGGRVASVGEADPTTGLVPIRAHLAGVARAGGFATIRVVRSTMRNAAVVPRGAVLSREGKDVVFVAKDGAAHRTEVDLGPEQNGLVALRKGVSPGQRVVVLGGHELSDGARIEAAKGP